MHENLLEYDTLTICIVNVTLTWPDTKIRGQNTQDITRTSWFQADLNSESCLNPVQTLSSTRLCSYLRFHNSNRHKVKCVLVHYDYLKHVQLIILYVPVLWLLTRSDLNSEVRVAHTHVKSALRNNAGGTAGGNKVFYIPFSRSL